MKTPLSTTEMSNPETARLDQKTPLQLARLFNAQDRQAARAVRHAQKEIAVAISWAAQTYQAQHKIIFIGAGTSGRLGILEAAECVPTFSTKPTQIIGLIAGGKKAVFQAQEGAEDNRLQGKQEIARHARAHDLVIGIAASGNTPYVQGALEQAKHLGARTVLIACNAQADTTYADLFIFLPTGPEALTGSTRLKAASATKMVLNAITTGAMALSGKTYGNLMVDVKPTNQKLQARAIRLVCTLAKTDEKTAQRLLARSGGNVKTAVLMHRRACSRAQAEKLLRQAGGFLAEVLDA